MLRKRITKALGVHAVAGAVVLAFCPAGFGGVLEALGFHCPPPYEHCQEGPPRLKFKTVCPRPVCRPCDLKHFGYYQNCWTPYPWPPDWSHCPLPVAMIEDVVPVVPVVPSPKVCSPNTARPTGRPSTDNSLPPPPRPDNPSALPRLPKSAPIPSQQDRVPKPMGPCPADRP